MTNLVRESKLGYFRRYSGVVVEEGYDASVEGPLLGVARPSKVLSVGLVFLTDTTAGTCTNK